MHIMGLTIISQITTQRNETRNMFILLIAKEDSSDLKIDKNLNVICGRDSDSK